jgi:hypothetical protein
MVEENMKREGTVALTVLLQMETVSRLSREETD